MLVEQDKNSNYHWDLAESKSTGQFRFWDKFLDAMAELHITVQSNSSPFNITGPTIFDTVNN